MWTTAFFMLIPHDSWPGVVPSNRSGMIRKGLEYLETKPSNRQETTQVHFKFSCIHIHPTHDNNTSYSNGIQGIKTQILNFKLY